MQRFRLSTAFLQDGSSVNVYRYRGTFVDGTHFIRLEGGCSKDRLRLYHLFTSFVLDLNDKNYKKEKMKGGLCWMKKYRE